ncbi:hypothetical protein B0H63DRAFT_523620 [Podospora didyma]|uniref:Secreted protein n=1 Tax=Podospora didyma TaxID=330526 RepID=A0AAE0NG18_9PEZI|nr:hypothetical protein B0H63DRAFT_523620 [Podospora didyma]
MVVPVLGAGVAAVLAWASPRFGQDRQDGSQVPLVSSIEPSPPCLQSPSRQEFLSAPSLVESVTNSSSQYDLCGLQANLWPLDHPNTCTVLLALPGHSWSPSSSTDLPTLPWPVLPHELLAIDLFAVAKLKPEERRDALTAAWEERAGHIEQWTDGSGKKGGWLPSMFDSSKKPSLGKYSTLKNRLLELSSVAAGILKNEKTWKVCVNRMAVNTRPWSGWRLIPRQPDDDDARAKRLKALCPRLAHHE